jgi:hypothetical protein
MTYTSANNSLSTADKFGDIAVQTHPQYSEYENDWQQMRDTYAGERVVKAASTTYLPKTAGQEADGTDGAKAYDAYKLRAVFHDFVSTTVKDMLGLLEKEPTLYKFPARLEPMRESATDEGDKLLVLHRRVHEEQLITSRVGLLLDPPTETSPAPIPQVVQYNSETILNWDSDNKIPQWIVLDESRYQLNRETFTWEWVEEYRLLALDAETGVYFSRSYDEYPSELVLVQQEGDAVPMMNGNTIDFIPFVCINAASLGLDVESPMLLGLSNLALAVYRGEADYRQALFLQAQDTLVLSGFSEQEATSIRVGAGAAIRSQNIDAKAEFIGITSDGLTEMRESQDALTSQAKDMGVELRDKSGVESGDAILTRLTVRTATLTTVAKVAAAGIQGLLRMAALWIGVGPEEVVVTPNTDFSDSSPGGRHDP